MRKYIIILLTAALWSCTSGDKSGKVEEENLVSSVLIGSDDLGRPASLLVTDDNLIVSNAFMGDSLIDVYSLDGHHLKSFLPKGEGLWIVNMQAYGDGFLAADYNKSCLFGIKDLSSEDSDNVNVLFSHSKDNASDSTVVNGAMVRMANGDIIARNETVDGRFAVFSKDGRFKRMLGKFPDKEKIDSRINDWANMNVYYPIFKGSPDGKFAVSSDVNADIRYFMTLDGDEIKCKVFEDAYPNDLYMIENEGEIIQCAFTDETYIYTQDVDVTDNHAYILYIGLKEKEMKATDSFKDTKHNGSQTVRVYDKEGNLEKILHLDKWALALAVSPDDKYLYTVTESSEDGFSILRYEM